MTRPSTRYPTLASKTPEALARKASENARDSSDVSLSKISGYFAEVPRYAAIGSTTARIVLEQQGTIRPRAVILVHARATSDPGGDLGAIGRLNFYHDSKGVGVYEPDGLVADTKYDLTFLILE
jgi:hypothetical protein